MKPNTWIGFLAAVVLLLVTLGVYALWPLPRTLGQKIWRMAGEEEQRRSLLTLYGNVDIRDVTLGFDVSGKVETMLGEEGDAVDKGDLLSTLERQRYEDRVTIARADRDRQRAVVDQLEAGSREEEIARSRAELQAARAELENAKKVYERRKALAQTDVIAPQLLDDALEARNRAEDRVQAARQQLQLAIKGPRKEEVQAAKATLRALEAKLSLAEKDLKDTHLRAPEAGTVLVRVVEPGAIVQVGQPVYSIALKAPVWVRGYVGEPNLGRLRPGMPVEVVTDSRPDRPYRGQIGFVSPQAEFTPKTVQTPELRTGLVYRFRVVVSRPDEGLRQGMPVTLRIHLADTGD